MNLNWLKLFNNEKKKFFKTWLGRVQRLSGECERSARARFGKVNGGVVGQRDDGNFIFGYIE
jgi:hypothetical protein